MSVGYKWKISLFPAVQLAAVVWGLACPLSSFGCVLQEDAGLCLSRLASCPLPSTLWPIIGPDLFLLQCYDIPYLCSLPLQLGGQLAFGAHVTVSISGQGF